MAMREHILKDGAIPAKYKILMGMITDTIAAHPDGVAELADNARAAGATEAEITEAVEVGYLYGGTAALVMGMNAFMRADQRVERGLVARVLRSAHPLRRDRMASIA